MSLSEIISYNTLRIVGCFQKNRSLWKITKLIGCLFYTAAGHLYGSLWVYMFFSIDDGTLHSQVIRFLFLVIWRHSNWQPPIDPHAFRIAQNMSTQWILAVRKFPHPHLNRGNGRMVGCLGGVKKIKASQKAFATILEAHDAGGHFRGLGQNTTRMHILAVLGTSA